MKKQEEVRQEKLNKLEFVFIWCKILESKNPQPKDKEGKTCLSAYDIVRYVKEEMSSEEKGQAQEHIMACDWCTYQLALYYKQEVVREYDDYLFI